MKKIYFTAMSLICAVGMLFAGEVQTSPAAGEVSLSVSKKEKSKEKKTETKEEKKTRKGWFLKKKKKAQPEAPKDSVKVEKPAVDRPGLFHVTKEKDDWFFQVPDSLMGREFLTTTRFTSTPAECGKFGGEQVGEQVVYFQKAPNGQMLLRASLIINESDTTQLINRAITISNENPIIGSFKIESHKDGMYKLKVTQFFNQDNPAMGLPQWAKQQYGLQGQIGDMSYIEDIKSFPMNTEVRVVKTYGTNNSSTLPAARATGKVTFGLNVSFVLLPAKPMMRRYYDPRVGFFADRFVNYTDRQQRVESKTFITRYRLEPRPEDVEKMRRGELVEPKKPIIYYIDPATPKQWRKYLIQGVNDWQVAFEKAGFKNAIIGKEWPENDTTMSLEDARYSVIRYLASPIENAYGPNVHDPRTGEIIESHICWYHNVMTLLHNWYMIQASSVDEAARTMNFNEELMGQLIRFVSSHEVGHSIGLRHNFGSSSTVPVDSLRNKAWVEKYGHTPSIMDYARFNYVAQPEDGISHAGLFPRVNDYDLWAIQWGYMPQLDAKDEDEDHRLMEPLVQKAQENPRLWWGDGEAASGYADPRRQTEDLGDDATKAGYYGILNLQRMVKELQQWTSDDEKDLYGNHLNSMFGEVNIQLMRYCGHVCRNIGGSLLNFRTKTDTAQVSVPQPLEKQQAALRFLNEQFLTEPVWLRNVPYARRINNDPQQITLRIGEQAMTRIMDRLAYTNELYSPLQFLTDLTKLTFSEADKYQKVTPYRMTLQYTMFTHLRRAYNNGNQKIRPAVLHTLQQLQQKTKRASQNAPDAESRAHWANLYDEISRQLTWK